MNTTTYPDWADLANQYTDAYGTAPGTTLLTELGDLYQRHPAITIHRLKEAADAHTAGRIHSPWGFVREAMRQHDTTRQQRPQHQDRERETQTHLAQRWIETTGIYIPTEDELQDELFGTHGKLKAWADDNELRERLLNHWRTHHPRALEADRQARERAATYRAYRDRLNQPAPEPAPDEVPL